MNAFTEITAAPVARAGHIVLAPATLRRVPTGARNQAAKFDLPKLVETNRLTPPKASDEPQRHKEWSAVHRASGWSNPDRWRIRSRTFAGIAAACAAQWGGHALEQIEKAAA